MFLFYQPAGLFPSFSQVVGKKEHLLQYSYLHITFSRGTQRPHFFYIYILKTSVLIAEFLHQLNFVLHGLYFCFQFTKWLVLHKYSSSIILFQPISLIFEIQILSFFHDNLSLKSKLMLYFTIACINMFMFILKCLI